MHQSIGRFRERETCSGTRVFTLLTAACTALSACGAPSDRAANSVVTRDSAGAAIVEQDSTFIAALPTWTLDTSPILRIDGDNPANAFSSIRLVTELSDGRLLVVDARHRDVREYSADGAFLRTMMPVGRGPGEVDFVQRIQLLDDGRLAVFDASQRRISLFTSAGDYVEQIMYPRADDRDDLRPLALLGDSRFLASVRRRWIPSAVMDDRVRRDTFALVTVLTPTAADSNAILRIDTIALVPDVEGFETITTEQGESYPDRDYVRYGRSTDVAWKGSRLVIGTNERFELREYRDAALSRLTRVAVSPEPVPTDAADRVRAEVAASVESQPIPASVKVEWEAMRRRWRFATVFPYHDGLQIGQDGTLWAQTPSVWPTDAQRFLVFDAGGQAIARVVLPPGVTPHVVSRERVLGVWIDEDDVPHVRAWRVLSQ